MALDPLVLVLVLVAALCHASWNALVKAGDDKLVMQTYVILVPTAPALIALFLLPAMDSAAWPYLALSTLLHFFYYAILIGAYRHGDLSQVYPISRGSAPVLVAIGAWVFAREVLSPLETLGVLVVSGGIVSLAWRRRPLDAPPGAPRDRSRLGPRGGEAKAITLALLNGLTIAGYALADGLGVRASGQTFTYIAWLFVLSGLPLLAFTCWRRRGRVRAAFAPCLRRGLLGGTLAGLAYTTVIWAMSLGPLAHIVALRETSVVIAAAIGTLVLAEPFGRHRIVASAVVAAGAVLLQIG